MFRQLPVFGNDPRLVAEIVNGIMNGKTNNHGTVTLATGNATSTTINDYRIGASSKIIVIPYSAAAFTDSLPYGEFTNNNDQTAASTGTSAVVEFDQTEYSSGVYLADTTKIYVRNAGTYNVQYSLQLANYANSLEYADVWFRKNGTDIVRSGTRFDLQVRKSAGVPSHLVGTVNTFIDMAAGDYVQIAGAVSSTDVTLESYAADGAIPRPAIPAVILTVNYVNCSASTNVYVSELGKGTATLTHFANSTADKTYAYIIVG